MKEYFILMTIFSIMIFLYGIIIYFSKNPLIPRYYGKKTKSYLKYLGKAVMVVSPGPLLGGLVGMIDESLIIIILSILTIIIYIVLALIIYTKNVKEK